jgi:hypothetical protein
MITEMDKRFNTAGMIGVSRPRAHMARNAGETTGLEQIVHGSSINSI